MLRLLRRLAAVALVGLPLSANAAETVYRCTLPDGRLEFRQGPCPRGQQKRLEIEDHKVGWDAPAVEVDVPKRPRPRHSVHDGDAPKAAQAQKCLTIRQRLEDVSRELRAGYRPSRGERLRQRRRHYEDYLSRFCE